MTPKLQSDHRHAAKNSLRSMVAFLMTTTHLVPKAQSVDHSFDKTNLERGPKETIAMVEKCLEYEVAPLQPAHITSTDDTSLYITNDTIETARVGEWHILSREGAKIKQYRNAKIVGKKSDASHGGFRLKLCFTISASGQISDLCIIVNGLSEDELPMPEEELKESRGIRVIEIAVLTPGCSINPQNKETRFLILCRKMKGVDQARHEWYDKNIYTRFVNNIREENKEMSKSAVAIVRSWRDGNLPRSMLYQLCI